MPSRLPKAQASPTEAALIGQRVRAIIGSESVSSFANRVGINRQWLHDILSGRIPKESSVATLSSIADTCGYSIEWLLTGKGMPNEKWTMETVLVPRLVVHKNARGTPSIKKDQSERVLLTGTLVQELGVADHELGVVRGDHVGFTMGPADELLVDMSDLALQDKGLYLTSVHREISARRAIATDKDQWVLAIEGPDRSIVSAHSSGYKILGRIRLIWTRL